MTEKIKKTTVKEKREILDNVLPKELNIFGQKIAVKVTNLKGLEGDFKVKTMTIRIHQNLELEEARSVLFHEALHACFEISGQSALLKDNEGHEEGIVCMLERAFAHIVDISKLSVD